MAGERIAARVEVLTLSPRKRSAPAHQELPHIAIEPLPVVDESSYPERQGRIATLNTLLSGMYSLTFVYDDLARKALGKTRRDEEGRVLLEDIATYRVSDFERDVNEVTEYANGISTLASQFTQGADTTESEAAVKERSTAIFERVFAGKGPPIKETEVDHRLGVDRFLSSEVLGIHIQNHDLRNPLTAFSMIAQLKRRQNTEYLGDDIRKIVSLHEHAGRNVRKKLLDPLPMDMYTPEQIREKLRGLTEQETFKHLAEGWNIALPETIPPGLSPVLFNEHMLASIFENSMLNSQKARKLLEQQFAGVLLSLIFFDVGRDMERRGVNYLSRLHGRIEEQPSVAVDFAPVTLRRRNYVEIIFRDNGIGNDNRNGRREWRRHFSLGDSDWSGSNTISGTGIAMAAHRDRIKELFPHTSADMFLRSRTDGKKGAEMVVRLPVYPK